MQILDILKQAPVKPPRTEPRKRKTLTLEDRISVIQMAEAGVSARSIARQFDVGKTQIWVIVLLF